MGSKGVQIKGVSLYRSRINGGLDMLNLFPAAEHCRLIIIHTSTLAELTLNSMFGEYFGIQNLFSRNFRV